MKKTKAQENVIANKLFQNIDDGQLKVQGHSNNPFVSNIWFYNFENLHVIVHTCTFPW